MTPAFVAAGRHPARAAGCRAATRACGGGGECARGPGRRGCRLLGRPWHSRPGGRCQLLGWGARACGAPRGRTGSRNQPVRRRPWPGARRTWGRLAACRWGPWRRPRRRAAAGGCVGCGSSGPRRRRGRVWADAGPAVGIRQRGPVRRGRQRGGRRAGGLARAGDRRRARAGVRAGVALVGGAGGRLRGPAAAGGTVRLAQQARRRAGRRRAQALRGAARLAARSGARLAPAAAGAEPAAVHVGGAGGRLCGPQARRLLGPGQPGRAGRGAAARRPGPVGAGVRLGRARPCDCAGACVAA